MSPLCPHTSTPHGCSHVCGASPCGAWPWGHSQKDVVGIGSAGHWGKDTPLCHPRTGPPAPASLTDRLKDTWGSRWPRGAAGNTKFCRFLGSAVGTGAPARAGMDGRCCPRVAMRGHCTSEDSDTRGDRAGAARGDTGQTPPKLKKKKSAITSFSARTLLLTPFSGSLLPITVMCHSLKSKYNA